MALLLGLGGCQAPGVSLELSSSDGLAWLVEADDRRVLRVLDGRAPGVVQTLAPGATTYAIRVPFDSLARARPGVDETRVDRATLSEVSSDLESCRAQRFVSNEQGEHLEVPLSEVAEVRALVGGELAAVADWPPVLDALSVKVPIPPCRARAGVVGPFLAEVGPLVRVGDRLGSKLVVGEDEDLAGIQDILYLDEDTLFVALPATLVLVRRGQGLDPDLLIDLAAPSDSFGDSADTELRYATSAALPTLGPDGRLHLIVLLLEWVAEVRPRVPRGLRLIELPVEPSGFGQPRLIGRLASERIDNPRLAVDEEGRFVIGTRGQLWSGRLDDSVPLQSRTDVALDSVALVPASSSSPWLPRFAGGGFEFTWFEGSPEDLGDLRRIAWSGEVRPEDSVTAVRSHLGAGGLRLFSASTFPSLHERRAEGWREVVSWFPEGLASCVDAAETCGRRRIRRGLGGGALMVEEDESLVRLLRECDAVFWVHPDRPRCAEHIPVDTRPYRNRSGGRSIPSLRVLARWGNRLIAGGDASILVEVTLD